MWTELNKALNRSDESEATLTARRMRQDLGDHFGLGTKDLSIRQPKGTARQLYKYVITLYGEWESKAQDVYECLREHKAEYGLHEGESNDGASLCLNVELMNPKGLLCRISYPPAPPQKFIGPDLEDEADDWCGFQHARLDEMADCVLMFVFNRVRDEAQRRGLQFD